MDLTIDFETRSPVDLKKCGLFPYAEHPDTEVMCLALAVDAGKPVLWAPPKFLDKIDRAKVPFKFISLEKVRSLVTRATRSIAQNSMFEYVMWNAKMGSPLPLEKLHDTMAQLAYHALPLNLDQAGSTLGLSSQKDKAGHKIMLKLCKPRKPRKAEREQMERDGITQRADGSFIDPATGKHFWLWHEDPADLEALFRYCVQDVDAERMIFYHLPQLPPFERKIWLLDQKINLKGVPVDLENAQAIVDLTQKREVERLAEFQKLTRGAVSGPRSFVALQKWVSGHTGQEVESVGKAGVADLLAKKDLPGYVRRVLEIKAELSKSSVAKFRAMLDRTSADGRLRGMFLYGGASTMRWAGRGVQVHNLPRDSYDPETWEHVAGLFRDDDMEGLWLLYDDPFYAASRCVRGTFCAPEGREFVCADFSSVEAVGLAYLAGEETALEVFRSGLSTYKVAAMGIFGVAYEDVTKDQRQVGKVSDLALGYGGGIGAYAALAAGYGIDLETLPDFILPYATPEELDGPWGATALAKMYVTKNPGGMSHEAAIACDVIKRKWRAAHPNTVQFWKGLEEAARLAIQNPGEIFGYRDLKYRVDNGFLKCRMPSGRLMRYFNPRLSLETTSWGEDRSTITFEGMKVVDGATTRQWARLATYSGKICENVVQGFCRDLLAAAMLRLDAAGYEQVLHVHDESGAEQELGQGGLERFERIMSEVPPWAKGMPITAKGWVGKRYRKD